MMNSDPLFGIDISKKGYVDITETVSNAKPVQKQTGNEKIIGNTIDAQTSVAVDKTFFEQVRSSDVSVQNSHNDIVESEESEEFDGKEF